MITKNLVSWQFQAYPTAHTTRKNLVIHAMTQPLFVGGTLGALSCFASGAWIPGVVALAGPLVAAVLQGSGHKIEPTPPAPFVSPLDVVARLFTEQFVTFPRFVFSGRWQRAWRRDG